MASVLSEPAECAAGLLAAESEWDRYSQAGLTAADSLDWSRIAHTLETRVRAVAGN
jgi:hypothetical protein